jgi:hypothetical protein
MSHVMVDLETLGTAPGSIILSIGAVGFDKAGLIGDTFYQVINYSSSKLAGLTEDQATIDWWRKQSPEAQQVLTDAEGKTECLQVADAFRRFNQFLAMHGFGTKGSTVGLWGNGADFDNVLLVAAYKQVSVPTAWKFHQHRCYRTIKSLAPSIPIDRGTGTHHNAAADAIAQALHLVTILRELNLTL